MTIKLGIILLLLVFIILMAYWVVKYEDKPKKKASFLDPEKSYKKAKEIGIKFPQEYNDALPGV